MNVYHIELEQADKLFKCDVVARNETIAVREAHKLACRAAGLTFYGRTIVRVEVEHAPAPSGCDFRGGLPVGNNWRTEN
jgi:hypothetical protein